MIDVGVVFTENIIRHIEMAKNVGARGKRLLNVIYDGAVEVAGAVVTAILTTIVSFLPVFAMEAAEGKLFKPLAFTKTFTMVSALIIGLIIIPALAHLVFSMKFDKKQYKKVLNGFAAVVGVVLAVSTGYYLALAITAFGVNNYFADRWPEKRRNWVNYINIAITAAIVIFFLAKVWMPLGAQNSLFANFFFVIMVVAVILGILSTVVYFYPSILKWTLSHKWTFMILPIFIVLFGITAWQGFD